MIQDNRRQKLNTFLKIITCYKLMPVLGTAQEKGKCSKCAAQIFHQEEYILII